MNRETKWIVHYTYLDSQGETRTMVTRLAAPSKQAAIDSAAAVAPSAEFVVQVHAESDEQFLGQVRNDASKALQTDRPAPGSPDDRNDLDMTDLDLADIIKLLKPDN